MDPFTVIAAIGVVALLLLQPKTKGAPTGQATPVKSTVASGKNVRPVAQQSSQLLAMGAATFGTDRSPVTVNLTAEKVGRGAANPVPTLNAGIAGFNLTTMMDAARHPNGVGLRGMPKTTPSGGTPSTVTIQSPVGVGPQANAPVLPPPSNSVQLQSGMIATPGGYASPNTPQSSLVGLSIPPPNLPGVPTNAPLTKLMSVPSGPNIPTGGQSSPALGVLGTPPAVAPFSVPLAPPNLNPLTSGSSKVSMGAPADVYNSLFPMPVPLA